MSSPVGILSVGGLRKEERTLGEEREGGVSDHPQKREPGNEPEVVEDAVYHFRMLSSVMSTVSLRR